MALLKGMKTDAASLVLLAGELAFFAIRGYYIQKVGKVGRRRRVRNASLRTRRLRTCWDAVDGRRCRRFLGRIEEDRVVALSDLLNARLR